VTLSIVVPVLDDARHLAALLPELACDCPGIEVVVADGGSRDGSVELAASVPGVRLVASERGRARQMNAGAAVATGDILLFLHADTRLPERAIPAIQGALADLSVAYGRFDVLFDSARPVLRLVAALMNLRSLVTGICTGDQAIFVRRAAFARVGGYEEIALMEDIELTRRLKRVGRLAPLGLRVTTSARRWERDGVLRTIVLMWALRFLYVCGVGPDRLHRWYYGVPTDGPSSRPDGSAPVVLQCPLPGLAPPPPSTDTLHARGQENGRHGEQDGDQERGPQPAIRVGAGPADHSLLDDEPDQHRAGPEQRSTSHGPPSSSRQGLSEAARPT
jgi:rSAM/selenodomain-associated transferase 2